MTQQNLFPTEQDRRTAIFDYFLTHHDIILVWQEEYDNLETNYPEEYAQYLEYEKKKH
jgi:hypothetical protein